MERQRNLNILNVVLAQREDFILHTCRLSTTAEILNLEHFVHLGTAESFHRARARNKTIRIQFTAVADRDLAVLAHADEATCAGRCTAVALGTCRRVDHGRQTYSTLNIDGGPLCQCQLPILGRLCPAIAAEHRHIHLFSVHGKILIKGNQQGGSGRNGKVTGNRTAVHQHDALIARRVLAVFRCFRQIIKQTNRRNGCIRDYFCSANNNNSIVIQFL